MDPTVHDSRPPVKVSGSEALAQGSVDAGVRYVTGYPGSPATATLEALLRLAGADVQAEWATNEKSAFDSAFGASLAGVRALVCIKSVGLNVALDSLMVSNLDAGDGGFVILVGDDPGGWGSQNEQDSRPLLASAEIPVLEPISVADARHAMRHAFKLSESFRIPVAIRITRAFALDRREMHLKEMPPLSSPPPRFLRERDRFKVLPIRVVELHKRLQATMADISHLFDGSALNVREDAGGLGCIAAGYAHQKLARLAAHEEQPSMSILGLATLNPLPERLLASFLGGLRSVVVFEETAPYVEIQVRALTQRWGLTLPIYGRGSGHIPATGELFAQQMNQALGEVTGKPSSSLPAEFERTMPSRRPLCDGCPYVPTFRALLSAMERHGGRDAFVITGETGCMVRAQLPPFELLDIKYGMGSSIGLAAGLARSGISQRVIAVSGDSALLHSGLAELIDACQAGIRLAVIVLANETTALSGGQPHPGTGMDARGRPRQAVDLCALVQSAGSGLVRVVDPHDCKALAAALEQALAFEGVAVIVARRGCPDPA